MGIDRIMKLFIPVFCLIESSQSSALMAHIRLTVSNEPKSVLTTET